MTIVLILMIQYCSRQSNFFLTLLHLERPKLYTILAFLCAIGLRSLSGHAMQCLDNVMLRQCKSRKENPQKLTQLSSRSHPRHLVGKRTAQKDITIDTTSDSQVNSNFPNRWSPASLTFNNYFYLFLYNMNNHK